MKRKFQFGVALALIGLMVSCSTSNNVASNRNIQKRKYNKGFFIDFGKKAGGGQKDEIVSTETVGEETLVVEVAVEKDKVAAQKVNEKATTVYAPVQTVTEVMETPAEVANKSGVQTENNTVAETKKRSKIKDVRALKSDIKVVKQEVKKAKKAKLQNQANDDAILYYVLAFFIPFLAVGLVTDWDVRQVIINLLLCLLCGIPGIIHAFIVVSRNV